jgi:hypothetical protein
MRRAISPVFFVLALACFFLPFFSISCQGAEQLGNLPGAEQADFPEVTGFEVVTGAAQDELSDPEGAAQAGIPAEQVPTIDMGTTQIFAIAAAALAVLGILVALARGRSGGLLAIGAGVLGAVVLFLASVMFSSAVSGFNDEFRSFVQQQGGEELGELGPVAGFINFQADNEIGFWLSLLAFILAAAAGAFLLFTAGRPTAAPAGGTATGFGAPSAPPPSAPPPATPPPAAPPPAAPPPGSPPGGAPPSEPPPPTRP